MKSNLGSTSRRGIAGNIKLRGKLTHQLSCRCCDVVNCKWVERLKEADREMLDYSREKDNDSVYRSSGMEEA